MKQISILALILIASVTSTFAQTLPDKCSVYKPSVLITRVLRQSDVDKLMKSPDYCQSESKNARKEPWVVYSDRNDNIAYTTSSSNKVANKLQMNEKLRIAAIENKRALVYVEPKEATIWPKISPQAQCKGWVDMDKLLLWSICLSDDMGVYKKAILCINGNVYDSISNTNRGIGYYNPSDLSKKTKLSRRFHFYYVIKKITSQGKKMVLLATQPLMEGKAENVLYLWVPEENYLAWNQRSCLETTWNKDDIDFFARQNYIATVYEDQKMQKASSKRKFTIDRTDPYPDEDDEYYRWSPHVMRFPILDGTTPNATKYHCNALIGQMGGEQIDSSLIKIYQVLDEKSNVNIAILLDATKSMNVYSESVYQAIKEGCEYFDKGYQIKVGVMLYRDVADGPYEIEWFPFTAPNNPKLLTFIQSGGKYGYKSDPKDKTNTESLFYGMNEVLKRFNHPEQSNILLVVGDCGNNIIDKRVTTKLIVDKLVAKEVNVVGFQVRNPNKADWTCFNTDIQSVIRESLQKRYDGIKVGSTVYGKPNADHSGMNFKNSKDAKDILFMGEHRYALSGSEMSAHHLKNIMSQTIGGYKTKVQKLLNEIYEITKTGPIIDGGKPGDPNQWDMTDEFLNKRFLGSKVSGLIGYTGWTYKTKNERNIWMANVFFTHEELSNLITGLQPLYMIALNSKADDRAPFLNAVKECIAKMAPGTDLKNANIDEVLRRIMGINELTPILKHKVVDVLDNQKVSNAEYRAILSDFKMNYEKLRSIVQNKTYKYKFDSNGVTYYWIPVQDMP